MDELANVKYLWQGGKLVPLEDAKVHVLTPTFMWGTNVFEGIRGYWNEKKGEMFCVRMNDHFKRLTESAKMMRMELPFPIERYESYVRELIVENGLREDIHIVQVIYLDGIGHPRWYATSPTNMLIYAVSKARVYDLQRGVKATVSSWKRTADNVVSPRIKCGSNYQNARLAAIQAISDGYEAVFMLNELGKVSEGTGYCIFLLRNGQLITPPVTADLLESITSTAIIQLCREKFGIPVEARDVDRTELYIADELFVCGTLAEVVPIVSVDKISVGNGSPGPLTKKLQDAYFKIAYGTDPDYATWVTPMYRK